MFVSNDPLASIDSLPEGLRQHVSPVRFEGGQVILRQGEPVRLIYLIVEGTASVHLGPGPESHRVARLGPGAWLGELALLAGGVSSTTVVAESPIEALCATHGEFLAAAEEDPSLFRRLAEALATRLRSADRLLERGTKGHLALIWHERRDRALVERVLSECGRWSASPVLALSDGGLARGPSATDYAAAPERLSGLERRLAGEQPTIIPIGDAASPALATFLRLAAPFAPTTVITVSKPISPAVMPQVSETISLARAARTQVSHHQADVPHHDWRIAADGDASRIARSICRQRVGIALGGGGSRGYAHIGVLRALVEAGAPIDVVTGTSIGAAAGAAIAAGLDSDAVARVIQSSARSAMVPQAIPAHSLLTNVMLEASLRRKLRDLRFEDLQLPLGIAAVDLRSGAELTFTSGPLVPALLASMAVPGIFPPVRYAGRLLVDGGLRVPVPVAACRALGADVVIASRLTVGVAQDERGAGDQPLPWLSTTFVRALDIMQDRLGVDAAGLADVQIETVIPQRYGGLFDFGHRDLIEAAGLSSAREALPQVIDALPGLRRQRSGAARQAA